MLKKCLPWLRRHTVLLLMGATGFCGQATAQDSLKLKQNAPLQLAADSASRKFETDTTQKQLADTAQKKWLHRMIDKYNSYSHKFFQKDGKKHLFTPSLTDVRANLNWGKTSITPVAGFNLLNMKYGFGINNARTVNGVRYEAGGFIQGHTWKAKTHDNYAQVYMRGTFNIKAPKGNTDKIRRLIVEAGVFRQNGDNGDDGAAYLYGTYEKSIPKWIFFGKTDRDKTVMLSAYTQYRYLRDFTDKRLSYGVRGNMLKPFNLVAFKLIHIDGRIGPRVNWDRREGFTYGIELIRYFRKFKPDAAPKKKQMGASGAL